jgi:hypothetical protein
MRIMTALCACRFVAQIQTLVRVSRKPLPYFADAKPIPLACNCLPRPLHAKSGMLSLRSFAAPHGFHFGFEARSKGGRADRRRYARWRHLPSDGRVATHSNMRMVELCRNFSRGPFKVRAVQKEKYARPTATTAPKVNGQEGLERTG